MIFLSEISGSSIPLLVTVFFALLHGGNIAKYGLYASIIHEVGHIIVYMLLMKSVPKIRGVAGGVAIKMPNLSINKTATLLIAGIVANLSVATIFAAIGLYRPTYAGHFIIVSNLCVALFNALPLAFSDGGRLLMLFVPAKYLSVLDHLFAATSAVIVAVLIYILLLYGGAVLQISLIGVIIIITIKNLDRKK